MRNLARSLVVHEGIKTTEAKAKELQKVADKLVTLALRDDLSARRQSFKVLGRHALVNKLFSEIGPRFKDVPGGFTRVVKFSVPRRGDSAPMAFIEFSIRSENAVQEKQSEQAVPEESAAE
jgi:large subunit ribosomal protein L17